MTNETKIRNLLAKRRYPFALRSDASGKVFDVRPTNSRWFTISLTGRKVRTVYNGRMIFGSGAAIQAIELSALEPTNWVTSLVCKAPSH